LVRCLDDGWDMTELLELEALGGSQTGGSRSSVGIDDAAKAARYPGDH
jgi:hypothetical protein